MFCAYPPKIGSNNQQLFWPPRPFFSNSFKSFHIHDKFPTLFRCGPTRSHCWSKLTFCLLYQAAWPMSLTTWPTWSSPFLWCAVPLPPPIPRLLCLVPLLWNPCLLPLLLATTCRCFFPWSSHSFWPCAWYWCVLQVLHYCTIVLLYCIIDNLAVSRHFASLHKGFAAEFSFW